MGSQGECRIYEARLPRRAVRRRVDPRAASLKFSGNLRRQHGKANAQDRSKRRRIVNGRSDPGANTVDVATATWTNTIGDSELVTVWKDPDFDPSVRAVYYARVLEIPTPRWTAYDAAYFKIKITDPKVPMTTQERAFTSPIWYSPK